MPTGILLALSAPSGAGKSTLCRAVADRRADVRVSVSCTTRPPRAGERNGVDYHFLSDDEFRTRARAGKFLEWAEVHGALYGTPRDAVDAERAAGRDVLLNIDVQGALAVRRSMPESVLVFVCPPSWRALEDRLRGRNKDTDEAIARRLATARDELAHAPAYDYLIVNENLPEAVEDLLAVLRAERRRTARVAAEMDRLEIPRAARGPAKEESRRE